MMQKILTFFFQEKITAYLQYFNETLTNDVVNFEQPAPDFYGCKMTFFRCKMMIFFLFCSKHRLWVVHRGGSYPTLTFFSKNKHNNTPAHLSFIMYIKVLKCILAFNIVECEHVFVTNTFIINILKCTKY